MPSLQCFHGKVSHIHGRRCYKFCHMITSLTNYAYNLHWTSVIMFHSSSTIPSSNTRQTLDAMIWESGVALEHQNCTSHWSLAWTVRLLAQRNLNKSQMAPPRSIASWKDHTLSTHRVKIVGKSYRSCKVRFCWSCFWYFMRLVLQQICFTIAACQVNRRILGRLASGPPEY